MSGLGSTTQATNLFALSAPRSPDVHLIESEAGHQLFVADGSRLFRLDRKTAADIESLLQVSDRSVLARTLSDLGIEFPRLIDDKPPRELRVHALSLAIAQKCNLACSYCYAKGGDFGGPPKNMSIETARRSVDLLLADAGRGKRANLAFLGGEPLANRAVLHQATRYASAKALANGTLLTFSITTNGTLITEADIDLFEDHGFAVTVSLDGNQVDHDRLRPFKNGRGSFEKIMANVGPMLTRQRNMQVSARVTVTPRNLLLRETLDDLIALGFHSVGFSPMLSAPDAKDEMQREHLSVMLDQMVECGLEFERRTTAGERYPFANLVNALREIHRGTHRPYACGAGAGYFGVSADGELSACHRFVDDETGAMGDLANGVDPVKQAHWLNDRHVHRQEPCNECWARYLCGGGCHHEVINRGRPACDFIRGWLHYCLACYGRLSTRGPDIVRIGSPGKRDARPTSAA